MFKLEGTYIVAGLDGEVIARMSDESIYRIIKQNSRLIDRLNPRKMLFMTIHTLLMINDGKLEELINGKYRFLK